MSNISTEIIDAQAPLVQQLYRHWDNFMRRNVRFNHSDSRIHSTDHTDRVMLHALILGHRILGDNEPALTALAQAAVFHDTRRKDDSMDRGHGQRAARYYEDFCRMNREIRCYDVVPYLIGYHDRDDREGREAIARHFSATPSGDSDTAAVGGREEMRHDFTTEEALKMFDIFKDADALDRPRLGRGWLDLRFLRTKEALEQVPFGEELVKETVGSGV